MLWICLAIILAILEPTRASEGDALKNLVALAQKTEDDNYEELKDNLCISCETISKDNAVVMGLKGYLFIFDGNNAWERQLLEPQHFPASHYQQWVSLIRQRQQKAAQLGIKFFQMVVPDKQVVIPHLRWEQVPASLDQRPILQLQGQLNEGELLYPIETLTRHSKEYVLYPREESHWNALACWLYFKLILETMWPAHKFSLESLEVKQLPRPRGDLIRWFFPELEKNLHIPQFAHKGIKIYTNNVFGKPRRHLGHYEVWHNPEAPIKERIVICGNSFFYFQALAIFTTFCENVTFYWHNHIPWNVMKELKPDVLLWQTCERFLSLVPTDTWSPNQGQLSIHMNTLKLICDPSEYISRYPSLEPATRGVSSMEVLACVHQHYTRQVVQEQKPEVVELPLDFSPLEYLSCEPVFIKLTKHMPILQAAAWAEQHYRDFGFHEGRGYKMSLPADFSPFNYAAGYPDLTMAVNKFRAEKKLSESDIKVWLEKHYREHGIREGRSHNISCKK